MEKSVVEFVVRYVVSEMRRFDLLAFPEKPVNKFYPVRGTEEIENLPVMDYLSGDKGAVEEGYRIFLPHFDPCFLLELKRGYIHCWQVAVPSGSLLENLEGPATEWMIAGMIAHEVRHRIQHHLQPRLFSMGSMADPIIKKIAIHVFRSRPQYNALKSFGPKDQEKEFDATVVEVMVSHEMLRRGAIDDEELSRILRAEPPP